jgi:hypothetical protein
MQDCTEGFGRIAVAVSRRQVRQGKLALKLRLREVKAPAFPPSVRAMLRLMAEHSGHIERGGLAIREAGSYQTGGAVIGRTVWTGQPEWARGFNMNREEIKTAVEKAIARRALGRRQQAMLSAMLEDIAATRANLEAAA